MICVEPLDDAAPVLGLLERIADRLGHDGRDIARQVSTGHLTIWRIWLDDEPVGVVGLERYVGDGAGIALCAGEHMEEWEAPVVGLCFQWAKDNGAAFLEVRGRKGWARRLARYGFTRAGGCLTARV